MSGFDIVDSQIHLYLTMGIEAALATMDSLGIQAALIDEFWGYADGGHDPLPCIPLEDGAHRPVAPGAQLASMRHPDRFSYLLRVDHRDPELATVIRLAAADSRCRALRVEARSDSEVQALAAGDYRPAFVHAAKQDMPVFVLSPGQTGLVRPYIEDVTECRFIIDHIGMPIDAAGHDDVLHLGERANCWIKWCHAHRSFAPSGYPFPNAIAGLKRALCAFGRERILWASDFTAVRGYRWADMLFYIRDSAEIRQEDKEWILGRSVRQLLNWPAPAKSAAPPEHRH